MAAAKSEKKASADAEDQPDQPRAGIWTYIGLALVLLAFGGVLYMVAAFTCLSTRPCSYDFLQAWNADCDGRPMASSDGLMPHGQVCNVRCGDRGLTPIPRQMLCDDGQFVGGDGVPVTNSFKCDQIVRDQRIPMLVAPDENQVINEDVVQSVCRPELECLETKDSLPLAVIPGASLSMCFKLFTSCRKLNPNIKYAEHTGDPLNGRCIFGCFTDRLMPKNDEINEKAIIEASIERDRLVQQLSSKCVIGGEHCVTVSGSCNPGDDGDYYRQPTCKDGFAQWLQVRERSPTNSSEWNWNGPGGRMLHYDENIRECGQGGKWLLQAANDLQGSYLCRALGRQDSFGGAPLLGNMLWNMDCREPNNLAERGYISNKINIPINTQPCTCSDADCNYHGKAKGSKQTDEGELGCACNCDDMWVGDRCQIRKCKAPAIPDSATPACKEGWYIRSGEICTAVCKEKFYPSTLFIRCQTDGSFDLSFTCILSQVAATGTESFTAPPPPAPIEPGTGPCPADHCGRHGVPTGRGDDGVCKCRCAKHYSGKRCETTSLFCTAPMGIENAEQPACEEGVMIDHSEVCTPVCLQDFEYFGPPLKCEGDKLTPPDFACFRTGSVREATCAILVNASLITSIASTLLLAVLLTRKLMTSRPLVAFTIPGGSTVEVQKDDQGPFHTVKVHGWIKNKSPPKGLRKLGGTAVDTSSTQSEDEGSSKPSLPGQPDYLEWKATSWRVDATLGLEYDPDLDKWSAIESDRSSDEEEERVARVRASITDGRASLAAIEDVPRGSVQGSKDSNVSLVRKIAHTQEAKHTPRTAAWTATEQQLRSGVQIDPSVRKGSKGTSEDFLKLNGYANSRADDTSPKAFQKRVSLVCRQLQDGNTIPMERLQRLENQAFHEGLPPQVMAELQAAKANLVADEQAALARKEAQSKGRGFHSKAQGMLARVRAGALVTSSQLEALEEEAKEVKALGGALSPRVVAELTEACAQKKLQEEESEAKHKAAIEKLETAMHSKDLSAVTEAATNARALLREADQQTRDPGSPQTMTAGRMARLARLTTHVEAELKRAKAREQNKAKQAKVKEAAAAGESPNFRMTREDLWQSVKDGNVAAVRAGTLAMLSPLGRNEQGFTLIHVACQELLPDKAQECVSIVKALLEARGDGNVRTLEGLTPMDVALAQSGGVDAAVDQLRGLGLNTGGESPTLRQTGRADLNANRWFLGSPDHRSRGSAISGHATPISRFTLPNSTPGATLEREDARQREGMELQDVDV